MKLELWQRADGLIEIEWAGDCARFATRKEADAFLAGFRAAHRMIRGVVSILNVDDRLPIAYAPRT